MAEAGNPAEDTVVDTEVVMEVDTEVVMEAVTVMEADMEVVTNRSSRSSR